MSLKGSLSDGNFRIKPLAGVSQGVDRKLPCGGFVRATVSTDNEFVLLVPRGIVPRSGFCVLSCGFSFARFPRTSQAAEHCGTINL